MFILIDTSKEKFIDYYDHINELDDNPVLAISDLDDLTDYTPGGSFHVVDLLSESKELSRWEQLVMATYGVRVYSPTFSQNSPLFAGDVPSLGKVRRISVDGRNSDNRARLFSAYDVNYIGRTKFDPRNIFVLDNKKGNPLHDPAKDSALEALYTSLPDDWWGSCGFISSGNPDKLSDFFSEQENVIPLTWTTGGAAKLKYAGREFVQVTEPVSTKEYGIEIRDKANRLSYQLSLPTEPEKVVEPADGFKWVI